MKNEEVSVGTSRVIDKIGWSSTHLLVSSDNYSYTNKGVIELILKSESLVEAEIILALQTWARKVAELDLYPTGQAWEEAVEGSLRRRPASKTSDATSHSLANGFATCF